MAADGSSDLPTMSLFDNLLEQSRKLRQEIDVSELPAIQLGLGEIERRAKELKKAPASAHAESKAHYLLQAGGINADETLRELDSIDLTTTHEPAPGPVDADIESYLRSRKEQNILSSIEDGMVRATRDFDAFVAKNVTSEWDVQKKRIFEHFGLLQKQPGAETAAEKKPVGASLAGSRFGASSFGRSRGAGARPDFGRASTWGRSSFAGSTLGKSVAAAAIAEPMESYKPSAFTDIDASKRLAPNKQTEARQQKAVEVIRDLNAARLDSRPYPLIDSMQKATEQSGSDVFTGQLSDSWKLLGSIVGEPNARERQYSQLYQKATNNPDGEEGLRLRTMVEEGSRTFLQKKFFDHIEETIVKNPQIAKLGGIPSTLSKFKAYVNIQFTFHKEWQDKQFDRIEGTPMWALVFYMIRAGHIKEAADYVKQNQQAFQKVDRNFHHYINGYASSLDRRLTRQLADRMQSDYTQRSVHGAGSPDMFKTAVYKIIGRCELTKRSLPEVLPTADDWLWLQLVLTREVKRGDEPAQQVFTLQDLQKAVSAYAPKFSSKDANIGLYFQILVSCGLFEEAIQYLYTFQPSDAVHFAIALSFYGLINVSPPPSPGTEIQLFSLDDNVSQIYFAGMIMQYVGESRNLEPEDAVNFISLICLNSDGANGQAQLKTCHSALRDLVLDTRAFQSLLGDIKGDGTRQRGAIERRMKLVKLENQADFLRTITEQAALQAEEDGRNTDAVLLYHLAEDYDTVVQIVNKSLSEWIANEDFPSEQSHQVASDTSLAAMDDALTLATNVKHMYSNNAMVYSKVSQRHQEILHVLLNLADAKSLYINRQYEQCLRAIEQVQVIPLSSTVEMGTIRRFAQNFSSLHETVARNVAILLKMAVQCCAVLADELRSSPFGDSVKQQRIGELKNKVKGAMLYAGMIQYKLPAQVYEFIASRDETM